MKQYNHFKSIITEAINVVLNEYLQQIPDEYNDDIFDWNVFDNLTGYSERRKYCNKHLGSPIGSGLSRDVYEVDDYTVLKVGMPDNNQNKNEYNAFLKEKENNLMPKIYAKADDYSWLWSERVLPLNRKNIDEVFNHVLGLPYHFVTESGNKKSESYPSVEGFLHWYDGRFNGYECAFMPNNRVDRFYNQLLKGNKWFRDLVSLAKYDNPLEFHHENFGLAMRNGKPSIVVTDVGGYLLR